MIVNMFRKLKFNKHQLIWIRTKYKKQKSSKRYSDTLNLPRTKLPVSARGNEVNNREIEIQRVRQCIIRNGMLFFLDW